ncbi:MAG TPA: hypothetical protein DD727_02110, partial [Clostridiales bacterium]|nr:hypothetical protein [Clostridiales bacterium]
MVAKLICFLLTAVISAPGTLAQVRSSARSFGGSIGDAGGRKFPLGVYELPQNARDLKAISEAGLNVVRCYGRSDLDRLATAGLMGWVPVPMELGDDERLRKIVEDVKDHPALAAWEGPDEIVWSFTAQSGLFRKGIYKTPDEWWLQTPFAVKRADAEAQRILPKLREGASLVRRLDRGRHPIWINEEGQSDLKFIREYIDAVDITGCDTYPIDSKKREVAEVGDTADRFRLIGRGKPVWMVLQAFSRNYEKIPVYPTFEESRMMAYDVIAHGAEGIFYYTGYVMYRSAGPEAFRESLYALTSELSSLQPFLIRPPERTGNVRLIETDRRVGLGERGVRIDVRRNGADWLVILVNEDKRPHMGVEVSGLHALNGRRLDLLYGAESA